MLRGVAAELAARTSDRLLLGIDDAHLLDEVSAALTLHLAVAGSAFVVATVRDDQPPDDAIVALWKDAGAVRIDLTALDEAQAATVLEHALDGPVALDLRRWAFRRSAGNLLFLHELITDGLATGAIDYRDGAWQTRPRRAGPGPALSEMVRQRLRGLDGAEREAIELLSIGQPLPLDVLEQLVDDRVLAALERAGLITIGTVDEGAPVRLAHPLYGDVVDAQMTMLGGRALRRRLAAVVTERGPRMRQELRVATWLLDAGEPVAPDVLLKAAEQALAAPPPIWPRAWPNARSTPAPAFRPRCCWPARSSPATASPRPRRSWPRTRTTCRRTSSSPTPRCVRCRSCSGACSAPRTRWPWSTVSRNARPTARPATACCRCAC